MVPAVARLLFALLLSARAAHVVREEAKEHSSLRRTGHTARRSTCSCDCCAVTPRRPDEKVGLAGVKCAPADGHSSDVCGTQCLASSEDRILSLSAQNKLLDYQRFCFFECKPANGYSSVKGTQCLALENADVSLVLDKHGNAKDPAVVYGRTQPLPKVALASNDRRGAPEDEAQEAATEGQKQLSAASSDVLKVAERMRLNKEIFSTEEILDPLDSVSDIRSAAKHTEDLALVATDAAQRAVKALKEARVESWRTAMETANSELARMQKEVKAAGKKVTPTPWRVKAARAVTEATQDLQHTAMSKQQESRIKQTEAMQAKKDAEQLRTKALRIREQVVALRNMQRASEAQAALEKAAELESKAKELSDSSTQMLAAADAAVKEMAKSMDLANKVAKETGEKVKMDVRVVPAPPPDPLDSFVPAPRALP